MITKRLYNFLREWYDWATSGKEDDNRFYPSIGLCNSILDFYKDDVIEVDMCYEDLISEFTEDELDTCFPFGESDYQDYGSNGTMHKCPKRLAWVSRKINEYENSL